MEALGPEFGIGEVAGNRPAISAVALAAGLHLLHQAVELARAFLPHLPPDALPGQALACELYLALGVRGCEIGTVMFGKRDADGRLVPAAMELVRLAFPRRVYTQAHFDYILESIEDVVARRASLRGLRIVEEPPFLRHFTARFAPI